MPFVPLPPDRVYTFGNFPFGVVPQHQESFYPGISEGFDQRLTIYTGEIAVGHGSESETVRLNFQYPVLVFFNLLGGGTAVGIFPINDPLFNQFRSAVANVSVSQFWIKDTDSYVSVGSVSADLFQIELNDPSRQKINAVVLSGYVFVRQAEITLVSYRVSVLETLNQNPPIQPPIWIVPGGWTGKYNLDASGNLGPLLRSGIPESP